MLAAFVLLVALLANPVVVENENNQVPNPEDSGVICMELKAIESRQRSTVCVPSPGHVVIEVEWPKQFVAEF